MTIKNFNTTATLDSTGRWTANLNTNINAKLCIIRQITYTSTNGTKAIYVINSSLKSDPIGTLANGSFYVSNPNTHIKLSQPNLSSIEFWLTSKMLPIASVATDQIGIDMDLIDDDDLDMAQV